MLHFMLIPPTHAFQAIDRGENLTVLVDKTEDLRSQVSGGKINPALLSVFCINPLVKC